MTRAVRLIRRALTALASIALVSCATEPNTAQPSSSPKAVNLRGRIIPPRADSQGAVQFKTESNQVYTLVSNRMSSALFIDTNLQAKTLLLKGRVLPAEKFEVTGNLHSIHDGKTHELYYYCDVCVIKGIDPGPCMCCREPVVLMEEPAANAKAQTEKPK